MRRCRMNAYLHRSENRGHVTAGWLNTYHSFSFGQWYDPKYMGFGPLRVINEDKIAAHNGFGTHSHDNMEILTYVLSGRLSHRDTMGNEEHICAGEWQLMSAGSGVAHSEINNTDTPVHLFQIWIHPNVTNAAPSYQQIKLDPREQPNQWHLIAGTQQNAPMFIRQDAEVKAALLEANHELEIKRTHKHNYVHVVYGEVMIGDKTVKTGDALMFDESTQVKALQDSQMIWFDLPA